MDRSASPGATARHSYAGLCLVMLMWAGNSIVGRAVHDIVPPFTLALVRWTGAGLLALPFAWRHLHADRATLAANVPVVLALGLTGVAAFNAFLYSGLRYTSATNGLLLQAAIPAAVLLANRLIFGRRAPLLQVSGVLVSIAGVLFIVLRGDLAAILRFRFDTGDALILCGVTAWALYTSLLVRRPACHPMSFLVVTFAIGIAAMTPLAAWEAMDGQRITWGAAAVGAFAYVAVFPSLIAYTLYNRAVAALGSGPAGQTITLMPLFGALLAAPILGERLHSYHLTGMALILGGILLGAHAIRRPLAAQAARPISPP